MKKIFTLAVLALMGMGSALAQDQEVVFTFNTDEGIAELGISKPEASAATNLKDLTTANTLSKGVITIVNATGQGKTETRVWNSSGKLDLRIYTTSTLTFTTSEKFIKSIVLTGGTVGGFSASVGSFSGGTWTGAAKEVVLTATGNEKINTITVTYGDKPSIVAPTISGDATFEATTNVTITAEENAKIYYTTNGDDPTTGSTLYEAPIALEATTTVKAIAEKDGAVSTVSSATFTKILPATGGTTVETALTVAETLDFIGTLGTNSSKEIYVKGKVSKASTNDPSSAGKLTFYISDDGTTTNQLQAYSTLGLEKAKFTNKEEIKVGDEVILYGKVKLYNTTKEMDNGYVYSLNGTTTGISSVKAAAEFKGAIYNIAGQKVSASYKGLVIKNGKKIVQK